MVEQSLLQLCGPKGVESVVNSLRIIAPQLFYEINFIELSFDNETSKNFKLGDFHMSTLKLNHAIDCIRL